MKVTNMTNSKGNTVKNQFILKYDGHFMPITAFQSYDSIIVRITHTTSGDVIHLDKDKWDYSTTTGRYRNEFLGEGIAETRKKIASGEYTLTNLND